jgi:hypothetical protein
MVARISPSANNDLSWPALTSKRELRGSNGIGLHVACWISEQFGYAVIPMWPIARMEGRKVPLEKWKELEYRAPLEIRRDSKFRLRCGVAILAGVSGLVLIDVDDEDSWTEFCAGRELPKTLELSTHSGRQLAFRDDGVLYKTQSSQLAQGVDVRGRGGLFVVYDPDQPERHFTDLTKPVSLPAWLQREIPLAGTRGTKKGQKKPPLDIAEIVRGIPPGQHHDRLNALALSLVNRGGIGDQEWYDLATAVLARSSEGTDGKGQVREPFSDEEIMDFLRTAQDKIRGEVAEGEPENEFEDPQFDNFFSADDVDIKDIEWLNDPFLPLGCLVIIDGDPGQGKSSITTDMVARAASGLPALPFGDPGIDADEELHCGMIGAEDDIERAVVPRLVAAGYTRNQHVWFMGLSRDAKGKIQILTFPKGIARVQRFIDKYKLRLVIVDPISAFIGEDIQSHNEASVRRALAPLSEVARETGCCIVLVRHLNKDGAMKAMYRGTGSIAFSAIARSGIITGRCPDTGEFAIAQVKCSYSEQFAGVIRYSLERWEKNRSVVTVRWGEIDTDMTADDIAIGKSKRGPSADTQEDVRSVLKPMFDEQDTWSQKECAAALAAAGITANPKTIKKAAMSLGIRPSQEFGDDGRLQRWIWTTKKVKVVRGHNT